MDRLEEAKRLFLDALALHKRGDLERAEALYEEALRLAPGRASVINNLAAVCLELKKPEKAQRMCEEALQANPEDEVALLNLGNCRAELDSAAEALAWYDRVLKIKPDYAEALNSRGNALLELKRPADALASYERAVSIRADYAEAHYNRGNALVELNRLGEALASYDHAVAVKPAYADALYNRGNVLMKLGRPEESLASYDRALAIRPGMAAALNNRGLVLQGLDRREELIENYRRLLGVAPEFPYMRGYLLRAQLDCCDWEGYAESVGQIIHDIRAGKRADSPFHFLAISDSAADQLRCSRICVADEYPAAAQPVWCGERYRHDRLRVAYVSADFHFAIGHMMAGLFEAHEKARFELTGISLGPEPGGEMKTRLARAFDRFVDARNMTDGEVARRLRDWEIDIAVDLQGFTKGCRLGIFSHRPAPIQVSYLGYPGTTGADYIDYIIADRCLIPQEHHFYYAEQVVYLPDCYQVSYKRTIPAQIPTRTELGLPADAFVFCCFNNNYKITPFAFDRWMRLLAKVKDSVLWLLEDNAVGARNLRREAERRDMAPGRLIFAPRAGLEEYLGRYQLADLFLDTLPYNAHATASDVLWAGVPLVTRLGDTFAGRVAASVLQAAGLHELVTATWDDYERLALKLATDARLLADIKAKLARNRATHPLFDADRFRRHIEAAYVTMWERHQRGEPPASFDVPASTGGLPA